MDKEKIAEVNGYTLYVVQDECPDSPREWDNLGKMHLKHRRYISIEECSYEDLKDACVKLPVYACIHSGISLSTGNEHCPFKDMYDSGLLGWIAAFEDDIKECYDCEEITDDIRKTVVEELEIEVETYNQYLNGDVWGFVIEKDGDHVDSCWGYYGDEGRKYGEKEWRSNLYCIAFKGYKEGCVA